MRAVLRSAGAYWSRFLPAILAISALGAGSLVGALLAFLTQVLLARALGVENYGSVASALAAVNFLIPLAGWGIGTYWLRVFGRDGWSAQRYVIPGLKTVLLFVLVACLVLLGLRSSGKFDPTAQVLLLWFLPVLIAQAATALVQTRMQLEERYGWVAVWQSAHHAGRVLIAGLAASIGLGVTFIGAGFLGWALASSLLAAYLLQGWAAGEIRLVGHGERPDRIELPAAPSTATVIREAWPFALNGIFYWVYFQSDIVLLDWIAGARAAGIYNVAFGVIAAVYVLPRLIYRKYLLPKLHRWSEHDGPRLRDAFQMGNRWMLVAGLLIMLVLASVAHWLIPAVFGQAYSEAGRIATYLSLCIPLRFVATSAGGVMTTGNRIRRVIAFQGVTALLNVLLNLVMIPRYGVLGAALTTIVSEAALLLMLMISARRVVRTI